MAASDPPEVWLRGPVADVLPLLQPVAHALLQAAEEVNRVVVPLAAGPLWARPGGQPGSAVHLRARRGSLRGAASLPGERSRARNLAAFRGDARPGIRAPGRSRPGAAPRHRGIDPARKAGSRPPAAPVYRARPVVPCRRAHAAARGTDDYDR